MKIFRHSQLLILFTCFGLLAFVPVKGKKKKIVKKKDITVKHRPVIKDSIVNPYFIIIDKSDYELKVFDDEGWYASIPIVFGSNDLSDKMKEGDKRTPEGNFKVVLKKIHAKWGPELLLNYPNEETLQRFNERKAKGIIPKNAKPGGGIAIHAARIGEEWTIENFNNWTDGCISAKYTDMQDLYSYIPVGTPVTIHQ